MLRTTKFRKKESTDFIIYKRIEGTVTLVIRELVYGREGYERIKKMGVKMHFHFPG